MNRRRIKEITDGASLLGLYGALLILNRFLLANFFNVIIFVFLAVVTLFFQIRNPDSNLKWGVLLGCFILSFLFGDIYILIFTPLGIILGSIFHYFYGKTQDRLIILGYLFLAAIVYEIAATIFVLPIFGISFELNFEAFRNMYDSISKSFNISFVLSDNLVILMVVLGVFFTGAMEAYIVYLASVLVLKFLKMKQPIKKHYASYKPNKILAYVAFFLFAFGFYNIFINEVFKLPILMSCLCIFGAMVLLCYGYLACLVCLKLFLKKEVNILFVVITFYLLQYILIPLIILGFLYGSGVLRDLILRKGNYEKT